LADVFISYRRTQAFVAERIHERICGVFRSETVFLDRTEIKPGAKFPAVIDQNLASATVILAIIDPTWISVQDPRTMRRRLDIKGDWVRIEIERSLRDDKIVIPVLIDDASMPRPEQLPATLRELASRQAVKVHRETFADDVDRLIEEIQARLSERELHDLLVDVAHPYPTAGEFKPVPVEGKWLDDMMRGLPQWRLVESPIEDDPRPGVPATRQEIVRLFRFHSFLEAIEFMESASKPIDAFGHHPRWENIFKTVRVALSTWDIGHRPSDRDFKTAIMLERHYKDFLASK
jgi:pterin-4a-carbinolamine dehydratase